MNAILNWDDTILRFYRWRVSLTSIKKLALAACFALLTAAAAQIRIPLPWTPVPISGHAIALFTGAVMLGKYWGGASALIYIAMGAAGLPVFSGFNGGAAALLGPTGGYLIGFAVCAFVAGHVTDSYVSMRKFRNLFIMMLALNFIFVHGFGMIQLYFWTKATTGIALSATGLLMAGSIPFIAGDIAKIFISAIIASALSAKKEF